MVHEAKRRETSRESPKPDARRRLPSVDALLRSDAGRKATKEFGRALVKAALGETLARVRGSETKSRPDAQDILARAVERAARDFYGMSEVLNATGVLLHTGLGRAPLPAEALRAAARVGRGYADLEVERETGERGRRTARVERMLCAILGSHAQDAMAVNNNAAALLLSLASLAKAKEVPVSRGELIEIGGEFRLPEIMAASGAKLVEVGTTNRTRINDYRRALSPKTALILKVHPSNYRVVGFATGVALGELSELSRTAGIPLMYDVGSGLLERYPGVPSDEPAVAEALSGGTDLVCFSGDKLLGGPQAGIVVGRADLIAKLRRHPIARAVRLDKMSVAALESTLRLYAGGHRDRIPFWRSLAASTRSLRERARILSAELPGSRVEKGEAAVGGGSVPGHPIDTVLLVLPVDRPARVAESLRLGRPPVFCRTNEDSVAFDLRTIDPADDERLARALRHALQE